MIWYETPSIVSNLVFVTFLLTATLQAVIALVAGDLLPEKRARHFVRLLYVLLAVVSVSVSAEGLLALAAIEGGLFFPLPVAPRYLAFLPVLLFLYHWRWPVELPRLLRPSTGSFFIPLLLLPPVAGLHWPLSVLLVVFAAAWLAADAVGLLFSFRIYSRLEITRDFIPQIIWTMRHGIGVANHRGWILEGNPAFYRLSSQLGITKIERIDEFNEVLQSLAAAGALKISELDNGRIINGEPGVFFLQQSSFQAGKKTFVQMAISDISDIARTTAELERGSQILEQKNRELEGLISNIRQEEAVREREILCRVAHDLWSQRLTVAGLSLDQLLSQGGRGLSLNDLTADLAEISGFLEVSAAEETALRLDDLDEVLQNLMELYQKRGVDIQVSGQAGFTSRQQEALGYALREALANAVRHAYAVSIAVIFSEDNQQTTMSVQNVCPTDEPGIREGRGLHDLKIRVHQAGGTVRYAKNQQFSLQITFPKDAKRTGGA